MGRQKRKHQGKDCKKGQIKKYMHAQILIMAKFSFMT